MIALNEANVRRIAREYMAHYHQDRTHDGLGKDTPNTRAITPNPAQTAALVSLPRVGGLQRSLGQVDQKGNRVILPGEYTVSLGGAQPQEAPSVQIGRFNVTDQAELPK